MARPIDFPQSNKTLKAPEGMDDCSDMRVYTDGQICVSAWQLCPEEIEELLKNNGVLFVYVFSGATQPPISVATRMD